MGEGNRETEGKRLGGGLRCFFAIQVFADPQKTEFHML